MSLNSVDLTSYGPDPTGATDNTLILAQALNDTPAGGTLLIPPGSYRVTAPLVRSDPIHLVAWGAEWVYSGSASDPAFWLQGSPGVRFPWGTVLGLRIRRSSHDWSIPSPALRLTNVSGWLFLGISIQDFAVGIHCQGDGSGCNYNLFAPRSLQNNGINLWIANQNGGWADENKFVGGEWSYPAGQPGGTHIKAEQSVTAGISPAAWTFEGISFNAADASTTAFDFISGYGNRFVACHFETADHSLMPAFFRSGTSENGIFWPYPWLVALTDQGIKNIRWQHGVELRTADQQPLQVIGTGPMLELYEEASGFAHRLRFQIDPVAQLAKLISTFGAGGQAYPMAFYAGSTEQGRFDDGRRFICPMGIGTRVLGRAPADSDWGTPPPDGVSVLDNVNHVLYVRSGGAWRPFDPA